MAVQRPAGEFDITYAQDMRVIRKPWQWVVLFSFLGALYALPQYGPPRLVAALNNLCIILVAVQGLNLLTGYAGQISLGQAAFMMVGAYASALLVSLAGLSFFVALPLAALITGLVGLVFGLPSLRVKGFYLAMATLAAQFIIPWIARHVFVATLHGAQGIPVSVPQIGGFVFDTPERYLYISLSVVIVTTIAAHNVARSRLGRALVAIRDNDLAAELMGVNPFGYKLRAFFLSALYAGAAGALFAHSNRHIDPETFDLIDSVWYLGMIVIGGMGTSTGAILGATLVQALKELVRSVGPAIAQAVPFLATTILAAMGPILFGLILMAFLIFEPRGLAHRWTLVKAAWRLRPFSH